MTMQHYTLYRCILRKHLFLLSDVGFLISADSRRECRLSFRRIVNHQGVFIRWLNALARVLINLPFGYTEVFSCL